jgi:sugar O-acyltransferase (sialic acid O-acetyltransferase NeuD family)
VAAGARSILIWGAGGHGRVVADLVRVLGHRLAGYADRDASKLGRSVEPGGGTAIVCEEMLRSALREGRLPEGIEAIALGIGDNATRAACLEAIENVDAPVLVHPSAIVSPSVTIGRATVIFPQAVVNAGARIAAGGIVNSGAIIEHDCILGRAVHVAPGAALSGGVVVGDRGWIGVGATVLQGVRIGVDVMIGAGTVVLRDVPDGMTVVGNPGRVVVRDKGERAAGRSGPRPRT